MSSESNTVIVAAVVAKDKIIVASVEWTQENGWKYNMFNAPCNDSSFLFFLFLAEILQVAWVCPAPCRECDAVGHHGVWG